MRWPLTYRFVTRDLTNLAMLKRREYDGVIVSQRQSGTHWLIHMLTHAMASHYGLPQQEHLEDMRVIVRHAESSHFANVPKIAHSHKIPSPITHCGAFRKMLRFPRYVLLVRDIRASLVSHYERYKDRYNIDFKTYLHGWPIRHRISKDIWVDIRFLNSWTRVSAVMGESLLLIRYEEMQRNPAETAAREWTHFQLPQSDATLFYAAAAHSNKDAMSRNDSSRLSPVVRKTDRHPFEWYDETDRRFVTETCRRHLRDACGYDYADWRTG